MCSQRIRAAGSDGQTLISRKPPLWFWGRLFFGLLGLLSQPMMFFNPFLSLYSGTKGAEVARLMVRPRHFDAPIVPLHDRLERYRTHAPSPETEYARFSVARKLAAGLYCNFASATDQGGGKRLHAA